MNPTPIIPELESKLNKPVEITVTAKGILTGYFEDSVIVDIDHGPKNYMFMTKAAGFEIEINEQSEIEKPSREFRAAEFVINLNHELPAEELMRRLLVEYVKKNYPEEYFKEAL